MREIGTRVQLSVCLEPSKGLYEEFISGSFLSFFVSIYDNKPALQFLDPAIVLNSEWAIYIIFRYNIESIISGSRG